MRLVGLVLLGMGGVIVWDVFQGRSPIDHLKQLAQLFGHQQKAPANTPVVASTPVTPAPASIPSTLPQLV